MTGQELVLREETLPALEDTDDPRRDIRIGAIIGFLFFVVLLGWAALAPLDAGVYAQGSIAVSGRSISRWHRSSITLSSAL